MSVDRIERQLPAGIQPIFVDDMGASFGNIDGVEVDNYTEVPVVRIFPVCYRPTRAIEDHILAVQANGGSLGEVDLLHVPFMRKNEESTSSAGQLTPVGGKIKPDEALCRAMLRELSEETTAINPTFWVDPEGVENCTTDMATSYAYTIMQRNPDGSYVEYKPTTRQVAYNVVVDATNLQGREPDILQPSVDKALAIEFYTTNQTLDLLTSNDSPMVGGSRLGEQPDAAAHPDQVAVKNAVLMGTLGTLMAKETMARSNLINVVNQQRSRKGMPNVTTLDEVEDIHEILEAYERIRHVAIMSGYRKKEREESPAWSENMPEAPAGKGNIAYMRNNLGPLLGKDLLYYAQLFAELDVRNIGAVSARTTRTNVVTMNYLKTTLRSALLSVDDSWQFRANMTPPPPGSETTRPNGTIEDQKKWSQFKLASLAYEYSRLYDFDERDHFDRQLSEHICRALCEDFELTPSQLEAVHRAAIRLADQTVDVEASRAGPAPNAEQWHDLLNEIRSADIGQLMLISLGITQHQNMSPEMIQKYRFEASKCLALIMKGISIYPEWQKRTLRGRKFFSDLMGSLMGPPVRVENAEVQLQNGQVQMRELNIRSSEEFGDVIIDNVPEKEFESFLRKSLELPAEKIQDVHRYNIALQDDPVAAGLKAKSFKEYALHQHQRAVDLVNRLLGENEEDGVLQRTLGDRYTVRILDRRNTYEGFIKAVEDETSTPQIAEGVRPYSKGGRIVREKFKLEISGTTHNGEPFTAHCEMTCNPFMELKDVQVGSAEPGMFLGLLDKIADVDYYWDRLFTPLTQYDHAAEEGKKVYGGPSLYSLFHPPHIYHQSAEILRSRLTTTSPDTEAGAKPSRPNLAKAVRRKGRRQIRAGLQKDAMEE